MQWKKKCGGITGYELGYRVHGGARRDLRDIYEYIAYELLAPETAGGTDAADHEGNPRP